MTLPAIGPIPVLLIMLCPGQILSVGFEQLYLQRNAVGPEGGNYGYTGLAANG